MGEANSTRPQKLADFIGASDVKGELMLSLRAAQQRREPLDHVLLYGPPGLGKTSLANIIANEQGVRLVSVTGPSIDSVQKLVTIVSQMHYGDVLMLDEAHRLPKAVEEVLYSVLEDSALFTAMGRTVVSRKLPRFTVVGATTRFALVSAPLRDRFGSVYRLDYYGVLDLSKIVRGACAAMGVEIEIEAAHMLAERGRGTPRVVLRLLKKVRDYCQVLSNGKITALCTGEYMQLQGIDEKGLDRNDERYLRTLIDDLQGGPAGLEVLAARISEDEGTVSDVLEPYLMRIGFLDRSPKGRVATPEAFEWLFKRKQH